ncbi:hypothetical protein P9112_004830 [Eukaryota sp. TZLM1-RC]
MSSPLSVLLLGPSAGKTFISMILKNFINEQHLLSTNEFPSCRPTVGKETILLTSKHNQLVELIELGSPLMSLWRSFTPSIFKFMYVISDIELRSGVIDCLAFLLDCSHHDNASESDVLVLVNCFNNGCLVNLHDLLEIKYFTQFFRSLKIKRFVVEKECIEDIGGWFSE